MSNDDKLENNIKSALDQSVDELDAETLSRIRQARVHALEQGESKSGYWLGMLSGAVATACVLVLVIMLTVKNEPAIQPLPAEDLELISAVEELDFYDDLEFYQWLAEEHES